ncbi:MAG: TlyA family RNA methyltransferase [Leptospirillia bacterium]
MKRPARIRLDQLLVDRGLVESRTRAQSTIMAGRVRVDGQVVSKSGTRVEAEADITCAEPPPFVSRGGQKLAAALAEFGISPAGRVCLDAGASTGGFTDCLLKNGASRVYAVDVGYGQLDDRVANDPRVVVMDRTNVRHLPPSDLPETMDLVVGDLSFISLTLVLPALAGVMRPDAEMVLLVKPQFEVGRENVGKGGIVRDEAAREGAIERVVTAAAELGLSLSGRMTSPITGAKGNVEFLIHLTRGNTLEAHP